jgi:hypothetical protein
VTSTVGAKLLKPAIMINHGSWAMRIGKAKGDGEWGTGSLHPAARAVHAGGRPAAHALPTLFQHWFPPIRLFNPIRGGPGAPPLVLAHSAVMREGGGQGGGHRFGRLTPTLFRLPLRVGGGGLRTVVKPLTVAVRGCAPCMQGVDQPRTRCPNLVVPSYRRGLSALRALRIAIWPSISPRDDNF